MSRAGAAPGNENLAERKTREKRKMYSGCAHHCAAGTEFSHSITRDERSERASERLAAGNTVEWNGTERNGRSVTKYQLSPYQRATLYIHTESGVGEQCATCFSFVLDVRLSSVSSSPSSFKLLSSFAPLSAFDTPIDDPPCPSTWLRYELFVCRCDRWITLHERMENIHDESIHPSLIPLLTLTILIRDQNFARQCYESDSWYKFWTK